VAIGAGLRVTSASDCQLRSDGKRLNTRPSSFVNALKNGSAFLFDIPGLWDAPVVENFDHDAAWDEESAPDPDGRDRSALDGAIYSVTTAPQRGGEFAGAKWAI
jgi:hypothetical protein